MSNKIYLKYVPHGISTTDFRPIPKDDVDLISFRKKLLGGKDYDFVLLFNSRNIRRKQIPDTLLAFKLFLDKLSSEQADKCAFVLHTQPVDDNGTDLYAVREMIFGEKQHQVIFSDIRSDLVYMNNLYNMASVTILCSSNEGFGLSLLESLMAGTMIIANTTGGMQDQMRFEDEDGKWIEFNENFQSNHLGKYKKCGEWAVPVFPSNISIQGSPATPYIFDSRASIFDISEAILSVYNMSPEHRKWRGQKGRDWVTSEESMMTQESMCKNIMEGIDDVLKADQYREPYRLLKIKPRPLKTLKYPVSI